MYKRAAMNFELLWLYILSVIVFIITPGPVIALILKNTSSGGFKKAFWTILGGSERGAGGKKET